LDTVVVPDFPLGGVTAAAGHEAGYFIAWSAVKGSVVGGWLVVKGLVSVAALHPLHPPAEVNVLALTVVLPARLIEVLELEFDASAQLCAVTVELPVAVSPPDKARMHACPVASKLLVPVALMTGSVLRKSPDSRRGTVRWTTTSTALLSAA
jgi:hypothetical protein